MKLVKYAHRTVTQGDWSVSCTTGSHIHGAILHLSRARVDGKDLPFGKWLKGFGDGRLFPNTDAANQWAFDHGYLQLYFTHADLRARRKLNPLYCGPAADRLLNSNRLGILSPAHSAADAAKGNKMKYTYTSDENFVLRDALKQASISNRLMMVEAMADGNPAVAGFYAALLVRSERAEHIVWGLLHHFPADSAVTA